MSWWPRRRQRKNASKTQCMLYFRKAGGSRISNMTLSWVLPSPNSVLFKAVFSPLRCYHFCFHRHFHSPGRSCHLQLEHLEFWKKHQKLVHYLQLFLCNYIQHCTPGCRRWWHLQHSHHRWCCRRCCCRMRDSPRTPALLRKAGPPCIYDSV